MYGHFGQFGSYEGKHIILAYNLAIRTFISPKELKAYS
jgi:hypothetical protein